MAISLPVAYPLDLTGVSADNFIQGEAHTLTHNRPVRVLVPIYGGFFTESVTVVDQVGNRVLVKDTDYECAELYEVPTAKSGKEVCALILVTNTAVSDNVAVSYQAVGGEYSNSPEALLTIVSALENDNRPVTWPAIINKPSEFPPSHHLHDVGDVYGFEYLVHALERIRRAIEVGDSLQHDQIFRYIDNVMATHPSTTDVATIVNSALAVHIARPDAHPQYQLRADITATRQVINATTANTVIDLASGASVFIINVQADTLISFVNKPTGAYAEWGVITVNDGTAGRVLAFEAGVRWAGGFTPTRTTDANAVDEWWFDIRDTGAPVVGSLAVADAK